MKGQQSMFEGMNPLKIDKPIRLIVASVAIAIAEAALKGGQDDGV